MSAIRLGEHVEYTVANEAPFFFPALRARCLKCGAKLHMDLEAAVALRRDLNRSIAETMESFLREHRHAQPLPLTPDERERVRLRAIHRRGALRAGYGAVL